MNIVKKTYYKFGATMTTGFMLSMSTDASAAAAANNISKISDNIGTSIASLPGMVSGLAYLIGLLLGVLGILKIKDHVENPTNTPLKDGAVRIAAGGALFALPMVMDAMLNTIGNDGAVITPPKLTAVKFDVTP